MERPKSSSNATLVGTIQVEYKGRNDSIWTSFTLQIVPDHRSVFTATGHDPHGIFHVGGVIQPRVIAFFKEYERNGLVWQYVLRTKQEEFPFTLLEYPYEGEYVSVTGHSSGLARAKIFRSEQPTPSLEEVSAKV